MILTKFLDIKNNTYQSFIRLVKDAREQLANLASRHFIVVSGDDGICGFTTKLLLYFRFSLLLFSLRDVMLVNVSFEHTNLQPLLEISPSLVKLAMRFLQEVQPNHCLTLGLSHRFRIHRPVMGNGQLAPSSGSTIFPTILSLLKLLPFHRLYLPCRPDFLV